MAAWFSYHIPVHKTILFLIFCALQYKYEQYPLHINQIRYIRLAKTDWIKQPIGLAIFLHANYSWNSFQLK